MKTIKVAIYSLILVALSSANSIAQNCNFDVDKKDEFTGEHVRNVRVRIGTLMYSWWLLQEQKGPKYFLTIQATATGKVDDIITKGTKVLYKLKNDKVIEMVVSEDCIPSHSVQSGVIISMWLPKGEMPKETMQQMSESPTTMIRINVGGKDFNAPSITGREGKKIMENAQCLLKD